MFLLCEWGKGQTKSWQMMMKVGVPLFEFTALAHSCFWFGSIRCIPHIAHYNYAWSSDWTKPRMYYIFLEVCKQGSFLKPRVVLDPSCSIPSFPHQLQYSTCIKQNHYNPLISYTSSCRSVVYRKRVSGLAKKYDKSMEAVLFQHTSVHH